MLRLLLRLLLLLLPPQAQVSPVWYAPPSLAYPATTPAALLLHHHWHSMFAFAALQAEVLGELEDRVVDYLQKGTEAEGEVLGSVAAVLPEPLKDALPEPLKEALRPRPAPAAQPGGAAAGRAKPLATWTITSDTEEVVVEEEAPPMTPAAIAASQTGAAAARAAAQGCLQARRCRCCLLVSLRCRFRVPASVLARPGHVPAACAASRAC